MDPCRQRRKHYTAAAAVAAAAAPAASTMKQPGVLKTMVERNEFVEIGESNDGEVEHVGEGVTGKQQAGIPWHTCER